jgi:hypothetical protein
MFPGSLTTALPNLRSPQSKKNPTKSALVLSAVYRKTDCSHILLLDSTRTTCYIHKSQYPSISYPRKAPRRNAYWGFGIPLATVLFHLFCFFSPHRTVQDSTILPRCSKNRFLAAKPNTMSGYHNDDDYADDARPGCGPLQSAQRCTAGTTEYVCCEAVDYRYGSGPSSNRHQMLRTC